MTTQHYTGTRIVMLCLALLGMGLATPAWATDQMASTLEGQSSCEDGQPMLVAEGAGEIGKETDPAQSGGVHERAVPHPSIRMFKPLSIDAVTGRVMAQSMATGKTVQIDVAPSAIARHRMTVGVPFDVGEYAGDAHGNCRCGQYADGSCYCVSSVDKCCGPLHGCPIASCDKTQPIPGVDGKGHGF